MKTKRLPRLFALLLCALMLFSACVSPLDYFRMLADGIGDIGQRRVIPFSEMQYTRPDADGLKTQLKDLTQKISTAASFDEVVEYVVEANESLENFSTMRSLVELYRYLNINDSYYEEELRYCDDAAVELGTLGTEINREIIYGSYAQEYREAVGEYSYQATMNDLLLNSPEVEQYKKERAQLNTDYNQQLAAMTLTYEDVEYTMDDILEVPTVDLRLELYMAYYRENAPAFTETYAKMIDLDKQTAQTLGFTSVAEMYYLSYNRDYTPQDAMQFCNNSKSLLTPMLDNILGESIPDSYASLEKTMSVMPGALQKLDPALAEAWDSMVEYGLYDYAASANKQSGIAFTTTLSAYDAPFCYSYWEDNFRSVTTTIHEFGHFYDSWVHYNSGSPFNLDLAETSSQGLEVLMHEVFEDFTSDAEEARLASLSDFFETLLYQAMLEEFQQTVYEMDTFDTDVIARLYAEMFEDYGFGEYAYIDENGCDYSWFRITHLFDAPFYTISYCTSACVALQLWAMSQQSWDAAVSTYMTLVQADQNRPFTELIEEVGLRSPQERDVLEEIAGYFAEAFGVSGYDLPAAA